MLLGQGIIALGENASIERSCDFPDPFMMEVMKDPRFNAGPIMNRHG
jgi:hypothetical protein